MPKKSELESVDLDRISQIVKELGGFEGGSTVCEIAEAVGIGPDVVRRKIKECMVTGEAKFLGRKARVDMTGRMLPIPVYSMTEKAVRYMITGAYHG